MNKLRAFFAILLTVVTLTQSKPSQAAVGAFVSAPLLIAGVVVAGGGVLTTKMGGGKCPTGEYGVFCHALWLLLGAPLILVGLIMLDGEQQVAFNEIKDSQAIDLGITAEEMAMFNSEVDQVNMLMQEVKVELSKIKKPTVNDSAAAWSGVKDLVSVETFSVMQKIASQK